MLVYNMVEMRRESDGLDEDDSDDETGCPIEVRMMVMVTTVTLIPIACNYFLRELVILKLTGIRNGPSFASLTA